MNTARLVGLVLLSLTAIHTTRAAENKPPSITPEYFAVLRSGDVAALRAVLDRGAPINARDAAGNTPLLHAAAYGDARCLQLLLSRGAEVNATNAAGATALLRAASNLEKLQVLVERGADVNARSALGNTPLLLAARLADSHRTVEFLLAHGAQVRAKNQFGSTALMAAVASGDERSVKLLLRQGAEVNAQPTADEMGFLLGGGRTALMWAAYRGDVPLLKLLIKAGANVNAVTGLGTALTQASWANQTAAARLLIEHGARVDQAGPVNGYSALHWASSTDSGDFSLAKLLLERGANPNLGGGENVDAFLGTPQTPLMLARRRGETPLVKLLTAAGATNTAFDRVALQTPPARVLKAPLDAATIRAAIARAIAPLQETSIKSKQAFLRHASRQDCTSCHQQHLPMAALGWSKKQQAPVDQAAEQELIRTVRTSELMSNEVDWQPLFHPDASYTKGYQLFAFAGQNLPADATTDAWVNHLSAIQGKDGQWHNNLPRPPMQTDDVGATALAIQALSRYPIPGRQQEFAQQISRARQWLWKVKPHHTEGRIYQLLGLAWAGEPARKLQPLAKLLLAEQHSDGGWSQLPGLPSDAYATGQAIHALRAGAGLASAHAGVDRGLRFLLQNQLEDGTWHVRRRAFPFQPTMNSGFPHGRDSWISAAGTSWAVMALSLWEPNTVLVSKR